MNFVKNDFFKTFILELSYLILIIFVLLNFSLIVLFYTVQPLYSLVGEVAFLQQVQGIEKEQALDLVKTDITRSDLLLIAAKSAAVAVFVFLLFISLLSYFKSKIWTILMKKKYSFKKFAIINSILILIYLLTASLLYILFERATFIYLLIFLSIVFIFYLTSSRLFYTDDLSVKKNIINSFILSKKLFSAKFLIKSIASALLIIFSLSIIVFFLSNRMAFFTYFVFFTFVYSLIRYYYVNSLKKDLAGI